MSRSDRGAQSHLSVVYSACTQMAKVSSHGIGEMRSKLEGPCVCGWKKDAVE